jgi:hypothetical protein
MRRATDKEALGPDSCLSCPRKEHVQPLLPCQAGRPLDRGIRLRRDVTLTKHGSDRCQHVGQE